MISVAHHWEFYTFSLIGFLTFQELIYKLIQDPRKAKLIWQFPCHLLCTWYGWLYMSDDFDDLVEADVYETYLMKPYAFFFAYWVATCYDFAVSREKEIDWTTMFIHHIATMGALLSSDFLGYRKIGMLVLILHDWSDVWIMSLKLLNKYKQQIAYSHIWIKVMYILTMINWMYTRIYWFVYFVCCTVIIPALYLIIELQEWVHSIPCIALLTLACCNILWTIYLLKIPFKKDVVADYENIKYDKSIKII